MTVKRRRRRVGSHPAIETTSQQNPNTHKENTRVFHPICPPILHLLLPCWGRIPRYGHSVLLRCLRLRWRDVGSVVGIHERHSFRNEISLGHVTDREPVAVILDLLPK
jgi:hypothetical protein